MILHDFRIYSFTIHDNVRFGCLEHIDDRTKIEMTARVTGLDHIVQKFPNKYDTVLGRQFKRGHEFSAVGDNLWLYRERS